MKQETETTEPECIAVFDDYARQKIEHVLNAPIQTDEDFEELGREYDE
jgi:hypothetical protein